MDLIAKKDLKRLESVIDSGLKTFLEVGSALKEIRDRCLFAGTHKTFEKYVSDRFGMERSHAYRLIDASETNARIPQQSPVAPRTESQFRVLKDVPEEQIPMVLDAVAVECVDRKPTAKDYQKAVESIVIAEVVEDEVGSEDDDAISNGSVLRDIVKDIGCVIGYCKDVAELPGLDLFVVRRRSILDQLENARNSIKCCIPEQICKACNGAGCAQCGNHGWINAILKKELNA